MPNLSGSLLIEPAEIGGASISDTAPASPSEGQLWFESDTAQTYVYYDSQWIEIGAAPGLAGVSETAPASPAIGQFWFDSTSGTTNVYFDSQWIEIGGGATIIMVSDTAPASPATGQVWFNSSDGGTYVYYSSVWTEIGAVPADTSNSVIDAKGDLLVGTAADTLAKLAVGTASQVLTVDASTATGLTWTTPTTYATLASPTFTGVPAAPTAAAATNTTQIATTAFVTGAVTDLIDAAPGALDTLNELAAALGDDANYATTITTALGTKATTGKAIAMAIVFG